MSSSPPPPTALALPTTSPQLCSPCPPMASTEEFWAARRTTDSQELESWLLARRSQPPALSKEARSQGGKKVGRMVAVERKSSDSGNSSLGARYRRTR